MNNTANTPKWPDLSKDAKAVELAKTAMGWEDLTIEDQMDRAGELVAKAQQFKESL